MYIFNILLLSLMIVKGSWINHICMKRWWMGVSEAVLKCEDLILESFSLFLYSLIQWSPTFLAPGAGFMEDNFSTDRRGGGNGFGIIQAHYIYCALNFYYYYIVIYNEIITQFTITQSQWEPWACFYMPLTDRVLMWVCMQLIYYGLCAVTPLC